MRPHPLHKAFCWPLQVNQNGISLFRWMYFCSKNAPRMLCASPVASPLPAGEPERHRAIPLDVLLLCMARAVGDGQLRQ
jgi:hypothetical protein